MASQYSTSRSYDYTTGQDTAHKVGQERSSLEAGQPTMLYDGDIKGMFASGNRIRDLRKYLAGYGVDPYAIEVIPQVRLEREQSSATNSYSDQ